VKLDINRANKTNGLFSGSGTSPQKYAMKLMSGLEIGPPRFPIKKLSKESIEEMERDIKALNIDHAFKTV